MIALPADATDELAEEADEAEVGEDLVTRFTDQTELVTII